MRSWPFCDQKGVGLSGTIGIRTNRREVIPPPLARGGGNFLLGCFSPAGTNGTMLHLDLHVNPRREVERRQRFDRFCIGIENVNNSLMNPHLELLARVLVNER